MKIPLIRWTAAAVVGAYLMAGPWSSQAADPPQTPVPAQEAPAGKKAKKSAAKGEAKVKATSFKGTLKKVDKAAMAITVGYKTKDDLVVSVSSQSRVFKGGKPGALEDGVVGEPVSGSYRKGADGKVEAVNVRFGAKAADKPPKPGKKSGKKDSVKPGDQPVK